jgi:hypothetical protein
MKRRLRTLLVFLLLGAVVNIAGGVGGVWHSMERDSAMLMGHPSP